MSVVSVSFIVFLFVILVVYFLVPKKIQWCVLLAASMFFYCINGLENVIYILITAASAYGSTILMQKITENQKRFFLENKSTLTKEEKTEIKKKNSAKRKALLIATLVLNFGILCIFKYSHFALEQLNNVLGLFSGVEIEDTMKFIVPLGISFYTFQTMGYVVDVYWNKYSVEKNFFKFLLFTSFFPQITQGPISDFSHLSRELFASHDFEYKNYSRGIQRILWGFFKKMVVANTISPYVYDVFENYSSYTGITTLIGAFLYSILIYADFSGYMDIFCGYCEILGIKLTENFDRPYFSKSIAEYWRRWHISLGAWFKSYVYYPLAVAKWNKNIGKKAQMRLGKTFGKTVPASIALVAVWITTGLWHGASSAYVAWGAVNGLFIILSMWLEPIFDKIKSRLKINDSSFLWRVFQTGRTFILVTFIKVLPEVGTLSQGFGLWKQIFTNHSIPGSIIQLLPFLGEELSLTGLLFFMVAIFGAVVMFLTSLLQRKKPIRDYIEKLPLIVKLTIFLIMFFMIVYFGIPSSGNAGGFMYAQF